jgi:2-methylcitrate dehydratase PrpD
MAYMDGTLDMDRVRAVMQRIEVVKAPELDAQHPGKFVADITVHLRGGASHQVLVDTPLGTPGNPLSEAQQDAKFMALTTGVLGQARAETLLQTLREFDTRLRVEDLLGMCAP